MSFSIFFLFLRYGRCIFIHHSAMGISPLSGSTTYLCVVSLITLCSYSSALTPCASSSECSSSCLGVTASGFAFGCPSDSNCICDIKLSFCTFPYDCQLGQVCVNITGEQFPYCVSCNTAFSDLPVGLVEVPSDVCPNPLPSSEPGSGINGEGLYLQACPFGTCADSLSCISETNSGKHVSFCDDDDSYSAQTCTCLDNFNTCSSADDCVVGERCVKLTERSQTAYCVPCDSVSRRLPAPIDVPGNQSFCPSPTPTSSPASGPDGTGLYLQSCTSSENFDEQCSGKLSCRTETNGGANVDCDNPSSIDCFCMNDFHSCTNSDECLQGERCVKLNPWSINAYCVQCESILNRFPAPIDVNGTNPYCMPPVPTSSPPADPDSAPSFLEECTALIECGTGTCTTETNNGELDYCWTGSDRERGCTCVITDWICTDSDDCLVGTKCVALFPSSETKYCVTCSSGTGRIPEPILHNGSSPLCPADVPTYTSPKGDDFADYLQQCTDDILINSCRFPMECMQLNNNGNLASCKSNQCFCIGFEEQCKSDSDCSFDQGCFRMLPHSFTGFCISCSSIDNRDPQPYPLDSGNRCNGESPVVTNPTNSGSSNRPDTPGGNDTSSTVCIATHALEGVDKKHLIYTEHQRAAVLCDEHDNCATPGHIIMFREKSMMMQTYCSTSEIQCRRTVMYVNSVRMMRGLRISSKSSNFQYTTFAARYETWIEEKIISFFMRLGF